jgi:hypothetical protein
MDSERGDAAFVASPFSRRWGEKVREKRCLVREKRCPHRAVRSQENARSPPLGRRDGVARAGLLQADRPNEKGARPEGRPPKG